VKLSPKGIGVFLTIARYGAPRGVQGLMEANGWGRYETESALTELVSIGLIARSSGKTAKGTFWHKIELTSQGKAYAFDWSTGSPLQVFPNGETYISISQNSNIADTYIADIPYSREQYGLYANSVNQGAKQSFAQRKEENEEGEAMSLGSMPIDPDDLADEMAKAEQRKKEERKAEREAHYRKRQMARAKKTVDKWTPTDVVNYFAERCKTLWPVQQVELTQRPALVKAMYRFRVDNDTNGELDKRLLDMFLDTYKFERQKSYNPEQLFWTFINYAPPRVDEARRAMKPEDLDVVSAARAKARAEREEYLRSSGK
jgi:hypothetical protein